MPKASKGKSNNNMRILQLINGMSTAGAEILLVETSKRYLERGHQVDVCLLSSYEAPLLLELQAMEGLSILSLGKKQNIYSPACILKLAKCLKGTDYDIIHVHLFPSFYWAALAKYAYPGAKLIYTEHNTNNRRMGNALYRWVDNRIYPRYDCHIAISDTVRERLDAHINTHRNKVVTIYNGIDLEAIRSAEPLKKEELGLPRNAKMLLQVSAFRPQKNQETLIRALAHLSPEFHVVFAGMGELIDNSKELAASLGLSDRVHFLGIRPDVPRLLKTADIVVLSSHYEGLSLSSVEALASGKPFIATDAPGLSEVVVGAGVLFPDNDHNALASEIDKLDQDQQYYDTVTARCLERAGKYDINTMVDKYLDLYQKVLTR